MFIAREESAPVMLPSPRTLFEDYAARLGWKIA